MRTTVNLDEELLAEAQRLTGAKERTALIRAGLEALIKRESTRRLARLGGSEPQLQPIPRRPDDTGQFRGRYTDLSPQRSVYRPEWHLLSAV